MSDVLASRRTRGAAIQFNDVRFRYAPGADEMHFDLAIAASAIVAIMGPSGSGKSTLLSLVAGFETPRGGDIMIDGRSVLNVPPARRPVSMIFQENNLFAHLDVAANVGLGRSPSLKLSQDDRDAVSQALVRTGLAGKEKRLPGELSGGERQRVALARALVRERPALLLDEPFASLGPALRRDMLELVRALHEEHGMTILMVTHQPEDARLLAERVVFIEAGKISVEGPAQQFFAEDAPLPFRRYLGT